MNFAERVEKFGKLITEDVQGFRFYEMNGKTYSLEIMGEAPFRRLQVSKMSKLTYNEAVQNIRGYD